MTTTAFQFIFDNAESISINRKSVVGQTMSRNFQVRTVSRGGKPWRFEVKLPDGMKWSNTHTQIAAIDAADRFTVGTVAFTNPNYASWLGNTPEFIGQTWNVICIQLPKWTIFARDQVSWEGPFIFVAVP